MALDLLDDFPRVAEATLLELAALQGVRHDPRAEEEPGRSSTSTGSPTTRSGLSWRSCGPSRTTARSTARRNGSSCWRRTPPASATRSSTRRSSIASDARSPCSTACWSALRWIVGRLDDHGGGYLWVRAGLSDGIANQVWEDSSDSYYHADGTLFDVAQPYAPVAVQGYAYDALLGVAEILEGRGARGKGRGGRTQERARIEQCWATELRARAADLRARFLREFWQADLGTFALALTFDGSPRGRPGAGRRVEPRATCSPAVCSTATTWPPSASG